MGYIKTFWTDFKGLFRQEFKAVFKDSGVIVIFFIAEKPRRGLKTPVI